MWKYQDHLENSLQVNNNLEMDATNAPKDIVGGSRKSQLALIQTQQVIDKLEGYYANNLDEFEELCAKHDTKRNLKFQIQAMTTTGDRILDKPLASIGTKSLFTKELEDALLNGEVDFIVHSLKDLSTVLPPGCGIGAIMRRDSPDDVIVLKNDLQSSLDPHELLLNQDDAKTHNYTIGTSSPRRIAMLKRMNPHLNCVDIRGNLNTRFTKLDSDSSNYTAIILAKAGLDRMGLCSRISSLLTPLHDKRLDEWFYAVGQGAIAIECRQHDSFTLDLLAPIVDLQTTFEALAERSLMRRLEGGCSAPLGVRSTWYDKDNVKTLVLDSSILTKDGKDCVKARAEASLQELVDDFSKQLPLDSSTTTSIILSNSILSRGNTQQHLIRCSQLGVEVANEMIKLGCLELLGRK